MSIAYWKWNVWQLWKTFSQDPTQWKSSQVLVLLGKGGLYLNLLIAGGIFKKKDYVSKQIKYTFHNFHLYDAADLRWLIE